MYRQKTGVSADALSSWVGLSRPTYSKHEAAGTLQPTPEAVSNLVFNTGIDRLVWTDDARDLPDEIKPLAPTRRGPKLKQRTNTALAYQRQLANRLNRVIDEQYGNSQRSFALTTYIDEGRLSRLLTGKNEITEKQLISIAKYTGVSLEWLRTGEGAMLEKDRPTELEMPLLHDGQQLASYLKRRGITWTALQLAMGLGSLSSVSGPKGYSARQHIRPETQQKIASALKVPVTDIFPPAIHASVTPFIADDDPTLVIPRLPEYARAGLDTERYFEQPLETVRIRLSDIPINLRKRKWWSVKVNGDSMEPQLKSGDEVYAYELYKDEWSKIYNQVVIVQHAGQVVIKRIKNNRLESELGLWLHSDNTERTEAFFVPVEDLQFMWFVFKRSGNVY